jgi:ribonuclease BN (tRNA processing enzyme)
MWLFLHRAIAGVLLWETRDAPLTRRFMSIRVLGCSGAIARDCRTTAFLLDQDILIDAGTGVGDLDLDELARIDHILLSHSHLDHVLGIPLLADSVMRRRAGRPPIRVHALPATLQVLRDHLFNNQLWPDFTRLPAGPNPVLSLHEVAVGQQFRLGVQQRLIEVLPARHSVPAVGFGVQGPAGDWWIYSGDTAPNPGLWPWLCQRPLLQVVIEIAFSESEQLLARQSGHHCPSSLAAELACLPAEVPIALTHLKPGELDAVFAELSQRLPGRQFHWLKAGDELPWERHAPSHSG